MKKIAMALAGGALALTLAAPAGAAVASPTTPAPAAQSDVMRYRDRRFHECSDRHGRRRYAHGDCYDERHRQHDGRGSILF
jgi:hypothetical protein